MNSIAQKLRVLISGPASNSIENNNHPFNIIKSKSGVVRELQISKDSGSVVGLFSHVNEGMLLVVVQHIESRAGEEVVVFDKYDITGNFLSTVRICVNDIKAICPFVKERPRTIFTK